jgi:putative flippase GtrA
MKRKEIMRFVIVGCGAVLTDFVTYNFSLKLFPMSYSKIISFVCGSLVAFIANKLWTFEQKDNKSVEIVKFSLLYSISLLLNTSTNKIIFDYSGDKAVSFIFATSLSTLINFVGQKYWVFK